MYMTSKTEFYFGVSGSLVCQREGMCQNNKLVCNLYSAFCIFEGIWLIEIESIIFRILTVSCFSCGNLSQIPVVISLHFQIKYLAFWITGFWNQVFVQETLNICNLNKIENNLISYCSVF